jgi:hypothetical protein
MNIRDDSVQALLDRAIEAVANVKLTSIEPDMLITDTPQPQISPDLWTLNIICEPNSAAYLGPFVVDHSHPLTQGLSLEGVIWGAGKDNKIIGIPVLSVGNIPLLIDRQSSIGSHNINMYFNPTLSNMHQSPNWPILIWNLIQWRKSHLPGLARSNVTLGSQVDLILDTPEEELTITEPDGKNRRIISSQRTVPIETTKPGLYQLQTEKKRYTFAANVLSSDESDLTKTETGNWGGWQEAALYWWEYRPLDWVLLLIALAALTAHRFLTADRQKGINL